ncbi:MAG: hypothetical protein F6J87_29510 [Spirulina sp. SIO3F2]|nr:hypothetical protein [Spirulina sp. SIO3F2]
MKKFVLWTGSPQQQPSLVSPTIPSHVDDETSRWCSQLQRSGCNSRHGSHPSHVGN